MYEINGLAVAAIICLIIWGVLIVSLLGMFDGP
jgi:hypothetical protein